MAGYVPAELRIPTNITASFATVLTASGVTIMRQYVFTAVTSHSVYLTREAGAATNTFEGPTLLTANQTLPRSGWWVIPNAGVVQTKADSIATDAPVLGIWGFTWS